jgi:hypothetical protein
MCECSFVGSLANRTSALSIVSFLFADYASLSRLGEFPILIGQGDPKAFAYSADIVIIIFVECVASMKPDEPLGGNASDWVAINEVSSCQVLTFIRDTMNIVARSIQRAGMNIDLAAIRVDENKIAFPSVVARLLPKASPA